MTHYAVLNECSDREFRSYGMQGTYLKLLTPLMCAYIAIRSSSSELVICCLMQMARLKVHFANDWSREIREMTHGENGKQTETELPRWVQDFHLRHSVQTRSRSYPALPHNGYKDKFLWIKAAGARSKPFAYMWYLAEDWSGHSPNPFTSVWHCAWLIKHWVKFTFTFAS